MLRREFPVVRLSRQGATNHLIEQLAQEGWRLQAPPLGVAAGG